MGMTPSKISKKDLKIIKKKRLNHFLFLLSLLTHALTFSSVRSQKNNFLVISDIHLDIHKAGAHAMEISPSRFNGANDLDRATFEKYLSIISENIKHGVVAQPKFIILLGDFVGHLLAVPKVKIESESIVFRMLKKHFPATPLFYTFGNNDSLKVDYGPFTTQGRTNQLKSPYEVASAKGEWNNGFLSTGAVCTNKRNGFPCILAEDVNNGFYSALLKPGFRFISLNSVLFSPCRHHISEKASMTQLQWLREQLELAEKGKESVLLAMHIPPGNNVFDHSKFWILKEQRLFLNLIKGYKHEIIGILAAHTHVEELKIIKDEHNRNITGVYLTAALSTSHGNEPSVKTFYFGKNNERWRLSDYETFHFSASGSAIIFNRLYNYQNYYCKDLISVDLLGCLDNVSSDKMEKYLSAGNVNYKGIMKFPGDIVLRH